MIKKMVLCNISRVLWLIVLPLSISFAFIFMVVLNDNSNYVLRDRIDLLSKVLEQQARDGAK